MEHDQLVHPRILLEQMGKLAPPTDDGQTILHSAVAHALVTRDFRYIETLLNLGCPMYISNKHGQSILAVLFEANTSSETAHELLKYLLEKRKFEVWRRTKLADFSNNE